MGRGCVQLKRIENKINRQVTFSKRRAGLLKKAHEISVLCDAEVALIVFSPKGKVIDYASNSCMEKILERYERYSFAEKKVCATDVEQIGSRTVEHAKLHARIEVLQKTQKHMMGEEVESLGIKELQSLERQLETALKRVRAKKNNVMYESISELQKKDKALQEQNNLLTKKIKEKEKEIAGKAPTNHHSLNLDESPHFSQSVQPLNVSVTYQESDGVMIDDEKESTEHRSIGGSNNTNTTLLRLWMLSNIST